MKTILHKDSPPQPADDVWEHNTQNFNDPGTHAHLERAQEVEAIVHPPMTTVTKGQDTASGYDPLGWYWVGQFVIAGQSRTGSKLAHQGWVRFHLLNAELGGDGHNPAHLVPTRGSTNTGNPWRQFEDYAIAEVQHNATIHYHVEVDYHATPPGPAQPGDAHFEFFPQTIDAEYTPWDSKGNKWGPTVTVSIPGNQLNPPNRQANTQTHYLDGISVGELKDVLGLDPWLADRVANAKDVIGRAASVQDVYDTLATLVMIDRGLSKNPLAELNGTWPLLQRLFRLNGGHHVRISATCGAQDYAVTNSKLSPTVFQYMVKTDLDRLATRFDMPKWVINILDQMITGKEKMTAEQLYGNIENVNKRDTMINTVDKNWVKWMKLLVNENGPSIAFDPAKTFPTVTERVDELRQEKNKAIESIKKTKATFLSSLTYTPQDYSHQGDQIIEEFMKQLATIDIEPLTKPKVASQFSLDDLIGDIHSTTQIASSLSAISQPEKVAARKLEQAYLGIKKALDLAEQERREAARREQQEAERQRQEAERQRLAEEFHRRQEWQLAERQRQQAAERQRLEAEEFRRRQAAEQQRLAEEQHRMTHQKRKREQSPPGYQEGWSDAAHRASHGHSYDTANWEYQQGYDDKLARNGRDDADSDFNRRVGRARLGNVSRVYGDAYHAQYDQRERWG